MEGYSNKQIAEKTGLSPRMIQFFTQEGVVTPDIDKGEGRGRVRRYSENNLFEFALISELSTYGIKIGSIRYIINGMGITKKHDFLETLLVVKPVLKLTIRDREAEFGGTVPVLWVSPSEKESISEELGRIFEHSVSVLMIDLFQLYQRKCLGVIPEPPKPLPEYDETAKLMREIISKAGNRSLEDAFLQLAKKIRKGEMKKKE